jgi:hypothetical protein
MRKIYLIVLLVTITTFGQTKIYEFETFSEKIDNSFVETPMSGEVHINEQTKEISLITPSHYIVYQYVSKQFFIRQQSFIIVAYDWTDKKIHIKIDKEDEYGDYITFYCYPDEQKIKYFKLCLKKCQRECATL